VAGWEQVEKQVVEVMNHMEAMGMCVREYGSVSGEEDEPLDGISCINTPNSQSQSYLIPTHLQTWNRQIVPKCWNLNYRHR
jgi:hypothetical protein